MAGTRSSTFQMKELVTDGVKNKERIKYWEKTYCVIRDSMLGVDEVPICVSRCCK